MRERAVKGAAGVRVLDQWVGTARGRRRWSGWVAMAAISLGTAMSASLSTGCAVGNDDLTRWQSTEHGPEKLYAVVTHPKYSWPLRVQAAMALVRMAPREGNRVGLKYLVDGMDNEDGTSTPAALSTLDDTTRKTLVEDMTPQLIAGMKVPPPVQDGNGCTPSDPSVPYKDAAFAMLTHDPPDVSDEQNKADLNAALLDWVQSGFEARIDNSAQEYPTDKVMAYLKAPSVATLPDLVKESSDKVARIAALVQQLGDDATKLKMSQRLVDLGKGFESADWIAKTTKKIKDFNAANQKTGITDAQVEGQMRKTQSNFFLDPGNGVFITMNLVGGRPVIDYCIDFAITRKTLDSELRKGALAALAGTMFKGDTKDKATAAANQKDIDRLFSIVADESNSDDIRGLALKRMQEAPSDLMKSAIVPKLYTLFQGKKWQTRRAAATIILLQLKAEDIKDFLSHLPKTPDEKMAMTEAIVYGSSLAVIDPKGGPKPRDILASYMTGKDIGPKLAAVGSYFGAKKADAAGLSSAQDDTSPVPKCDPKDGCGWADTGCRIPKEGGKAGETELKTIATVGDFVKYCATPSLVAK